MSAQHHKVFDWASRRVTAFIGSNIVTAQVTWEGIWMTCVVESTGQMQCDDYDSMLDLSADVRAAQALMVVSIVTGSAGILIALAGGKCTNLIIMDFYNPLLMDAQKRELGASLYIGWVAGGLLVFGGALLCSTCPSEEDQTPPMNFLLNKHGRNSREDSVRSFTPSKTYI
ncbi:claudin-4-like [Perca flavescens]|uniref:claudin-4-like n=1 Tax=Perca flavescens TaxID=8167 RepID=UPI00106EE679|nr:claudin-4-like [Perca flavescens]